MTIIQWFFDEKCSVTIFGVRTFEKLGNLLSSEQYHVSNEAILKQKRRVSNTLTLTFRNLITF